MARIALVQPLKYDDYVRSSEVVGLYEGNPAFGFLSHFLKSKGHDVIACDANLHEDHIGRLMEFEPDFAGIRFEGYDCATISSVIKELRKCEPRARVVLGGPGAMVYRSRADALLRETSADYVVLGDGIPALHDIAVGQPDSAGVSYFQNGTLVTHGVAPYQVAQWQTDAQVLGYEGGTFRVISSVGCPHRCGFCDERVYAPNVLFRPLNLVLSDMVELHRAKRAAEFAFSDPIFLLRKRGLLEIHEGMEKLGLDQRITFQTRADRVLDSLPELAQAKRRIARVDLGVESFLQAQLTRWNKGLTPGQNTAAIKALRDFGIMPLLYLIVGDLESGNEEFRATTNFFLEHPDYLLITQPSGLLQYHDPRDRQYSGPALAFAYFFSCLWRNVALAWSEASLHGFKKNKAVPSEHKVFLREHFDNLHQLVREAKGNCPAEATKNAISREALMSALFLGSMYSADLDKTIYGQTRHRAAALQGLRA